MSKHLLGALGAITHPSFTQTVDLCGCEHPMALDIRLMDRDVQGNTTSADDTRYVRISDSAGGDMIYPLNLQNGEAYLRLEQISVAQLTLVQCDEAGNQLLNGDTYAITYAVNEQMQEDDYARVYGNGCETQCITIENMPADPVVLHVVKALYDEFQEPMAFCDDMNFCVHVQGCGTCETIDLNASNDFQVCMDGLRAGIYEVWEDEQELYTTKIALDGEDPTSERCVTLCPGSHTLEVINTRCPNSVLTIDQYIRDGNGELIKPQNGECYHIRVIGDRYDQICELHQGNDFAVELCDLPAGLYDVKEVDGDSCDISYLVNSAPESSYAHVEICEGQSASVLVINSVPVGVQESPLRICKYVRRSDDCLVKPDPQESFKVMLSGCGVCDIFNLNAGNNFCVDIEHICCGEYEVKELDHDGYVASYIVNDGCESTSAPLWIHECGHNCVTIINEERNKGEVTICKVIKERDGSVVKPEKTARFLVTLRSFFCRETYVLDASNDFCVHVNRLKEGSYEVKERCVEGYETSYMIDGGKEERKARFVVMNDTCTDVKVINSVEKEVMGDLRICKFIANAYGDYVKPSADEEFDIEVEGPGLHACYTLRSANSWCIMLEGLSKGVYRVMERKQCRYDTQYFVNGCEIEEAALVCMDRFNQEVTIVNTRQTYGNLKLNVQVEDCDGCMRKPNPTEYFDVIVESSEGSKELHLDSCNNFGMLLENLPKGKVRITQKDSYGYRVVYEVDGKRCNSAVAEMDGCNVTVSIINQIMDCSGVVRICKLVETLNGRIIEPCAEDEYCFTLTSRCLEHEQTLNARNDFCVLFDDLEMGAYEIKEACVDGMETRYRINGCEQKDGCFTLEKADVEIEIINKVLPLPKLCVHKRIRKAGRLIKPNAWESFDFQVIGKGMHETYCLNQENDWCVCLDGLCNQHYEVKELDAGCPVMYQINDRICEDGAFLFEQEDMDITIINQGSSDALVNITKMMRDVNGELLKPCKGESFEVVLENDCYKQCFTLDYHNDWCIQVEGLPEGNYTVKELESGCRYEVLINGCRERGDRFALGQDDVSILLINPLGCDNTLILNARAMIEDDVLRPQEDRCYHIYVEHDGVQDSFTLDAANDWCIALENICLGEYRISAQEELLFEACGSWFENCIEITMGCGEMVVNLYEDQPCHRNITITKRIQEADGSMHRPPCGARFDILLCGNYEECFELNEENNWTIQLKDYPRGQYEVIETGCKQARFQINDGAIKDTGTFTLHHDSVQVTIINPNTSGGEQPKPKTGSLTVHSMVKNCDGDLETAPRDAAFDVMIDGKQVREDITLTHRNGFQMIYEKLPKGTYTITQKPNDAYTRVTYRKGTVEEPSGTIVLGSEDVQIDLINYMKCERGSIHVMMYLQDATCGCLKRPCMDERFDVTIKGMQFQQTVILNESNQWSYTFDHLKDGTYTIFEEQATGVTYIVNGGKETASAEVSLCGKDANVKVIHPAKQSMQGSIELCKYQKDEHGSYHDPKTKEACWIVVKGETATQRVLLHPANHFYAEVRNLLPGNYEIIEEDATDVMYSVNGGKESERAIVSVNGNQSSVNVVSAMSMYGNITLTKMIQDTDGAMHLPLTGAYRVHVSAPGYNKVVTLDAANQYSVTLANLNKGMYVVDELDHDFVTYIVDGGSQVDRAVVNVRSSHAVMIINAGAHVDPHAGSIKLTKYIRRSTGQLVRPSGDASYQFHISKPGFNEVYTLNQDNEWSVLLSDLEDGNYVLQELDGTSRVSYIINDGSESDFGIIPVNGNANTVSIINSEAMSNGSMTITKYLRNEQGELLRPSGNYTASVHVSRPGYNEVFPLNRSNNWEIKLLDLMDGDYVLNEVDNQDEVTWRINGGYEVRYGIVNVSHNDNQVDMINTKGQSGNALHLQKFIRNRAGQLVKPELNESFTILISGAKTAQVILNAANEWMAHLRDLPSGTYHIKENSTTYDVSYRINDGEEQASATVTLQNEEANVSIINGMRGSRNLLEITKYIKTASGTLIPPTSGSSFEVEVSGMNFRETYTLNDANQFTARVTNLANGTYTVKELGNQDFNTTYRVNGGQETSSATITVSEGKNNVVETINEYKANQNSVEVYKYMMDAQGNFNKPTASQVFRFLLTGNNVHQFYTLNSANDWHVRIDGLASGEYEIIEQGTGNYQVQYLVNGTDFSSTGEFVASAGNETIAEIVNQARGMQDGRIELSKRVRNESGNLVIPGNGESFSIRLINEASNYDEIFTLDELNAYTLQVRNLAYGTYTVEEIDNSGYGVTYIVNGGAEASSAEVNIQDASMNRVTIINTEVSLFFTVTNNDDLHVVIE